MSHGPLPVLPAAPLAPATAPAAPPLPALPPVVPPAPPSVAPAAPPAALPAAPPVAFPPVPLIPPAPSVPPAPPAGAPPPAPAEPPDPSRWKTTVPVRAAIFGVTVSASAAAQYEYLSASTRSSSFSVVYEALSSVYGATNPGPPCCVVVNVQRHSPFVFVQAPVVHPSGGKIVPAFSQVTATDETVKQDGDNGNVTDPVVVVPSM